MLGKDEYKPRLIVVRDAAATTTVLSELKAGKSFEGLARQNSIAASQDAGGTAVGSLQDASDGGQDLGPAGRDRTGA
ncbi:hypothetical protein [Burkholderia sp. IT-111MI5]|uniref:hypothetical protein n=1 Tax=Burkholderia sp. IT-111MI5 TaxID=3026439 RepID=UPI0039DF660E